MKVRFTELSQAIDMAEIYIKEEEPVCIINYGTWQFDPVYEVTDQFHMSFPLNTGYKVIFLYWGYGSVDPEVAMDMLKSLPPHLSNQKWK